MTISLAVRPPLSVTVSVKSKDCGSYEIPGAVNLRDLVFSPVTTVCAGRLWLHEYVRASLLGSSAMPVMVTEVLSVTFMLSPTLTVGATLVLGSNISSRVVSLTVCSPLLSFTVRGFF